MEHSVRSALGFVTSKTQFGEAGMVVQSKFGAGASSDTRLLVRVLVGDGRDFNRRRWLTSGVPLGIAQLLARTTVNFRH